MKILNLISGMVNRLASRLMLWVGIIKGVRGTTLKMELGLFLSALIDTLFHAVGSQFTTLPRVYVSGIVYIRNYDVYFYVRAFSDDLYFVIPKREGDVNEIILNLLKEGDVFVDVGANVGYYSVLGGKIVGERGQVISIEPIPTTAKVLRFNIKLNRLRNVKVLQNAAWDNNEVISMYVPRGLFGLAHVCNFKSSENFLVEGVTLDKVLSNYSKVDLLKIDAEGSDYRVLRGARKTLERTRYVIVEASREIDEIIQLLKEVGFQIRKLKFTTYIFAYKNFHDAI